MPDHGTERTSQPVVGFLIRTDPAFRRQRGERMARSQSAGIDPPDLAGWRIVTPSSASAQVNPGPGYRVGLPTERGLMTDPIPIPDGRDLIRTMGWIALPYSCTGLVRRTAVSGRNTVWSWLILIPWADDSKPWIDGTEVVPASTKSEDEEHETIVALMRGILDQRYGETVGTRAVDDLIRSILDDE